MSQISKYEGTQSRPLPSWNLCTKYLLKYSILGNWVMKWLLYLCLILLWFRYLDGLPKTYFRKVEFNCKVQLSTSDLFWCPKCTSCPYVWVTPHLPLLLQCVSRVTVKMLLLTCHFCFKISPFLYVLPKIQTNTVWMLINIKFKYLVV